METGLQLANRFREVMLDGKWIANTNYQDQLSGLSLATATHKMGSLNTIAALAWHINYYIAGIIQVFEGGDLEIRDQYSFDLPPLTSEDDWQNLLNEIWTNAEKFAVHVEGMSAARLEEAFVDEKYGSYRRNIEGVIEHSYYHLGQISLIRKMI